MSVSTQRFVDPFLVIHRFESPHIDGGEGVNSYIIETSNCLIILDLPLLDSVAKNIREYADQLQKPIKKVFITHAHPDHWFGLYRFKDFESFSTPKTIDEIKNLGSQYLDFKRSSLGGDDADLPPEVIVPNNSVETFDETIDGVRFSWKLISNVEFLEGLYLIFDQHKILMAGDLVYNGVHHYVGQRDDSGSLCVTNWIDFLSSLEASSFDYVYAGHGPNAGFELIGSSVDYLKCVRDIITDPQKSRVDYRDFVNTRFPEHKVSEMIDISDFFVYGPPDSNS